MNAKKTSASFLIKKFGFKSVKDFAKYIKRSERAVYQWFKKDPHFFEIILVGAEIKKINEEMNNAKNEKNST